jgi:uncharacterized protein YciI
MPLARTACWKQAKPPVRCCCAPEPGLDDYPENDMLYLVLLHYRVPLEEVERHLEAHRRYLHEHYAAGRFLLSGPQVPRTGGAILARAASRDELMRAIEADPFHRVGVADYEVVGWDVSLRHADLPATLFDAAAGGASFDGTGAIQ